MLFSRKNNENKCITNLLSAESAHSLVNVKAKLWQTKLYFFFLIFFFFLFFKKKDLIFFFFFFFKKKDLTFRMKYCLFRKIRLALLL